MLPPLTQSTPLTRCQRTCCRRNQRSTPATQRCYSPLTSTSEVVSKELSNIDAATSFIFTLIVGLSLALVVNPGGHDAEVRIRYAASPSILSYGPSPHLTFRLKSRQCDPLAYNAHDSAAINAPTFAPRAILVRHECPSRRRYRRHFRRHRAGAFVGRDRRPRRVPNEYDGC